MKEKSSLTEPIFLSYPTFCNFAVDFGSLYLYEKPKIETTPESPSKSSL